MHRLMMKLHHYNVILNIDATIVTVMDALKMDFIPDDCFDLIIDKGYQNSIIAQILLSYSFIFLSFRSV